LNLLRALGLTTVKTTPANVGYPTFAPNLDVSIIGGRVVFDYYDSEKRIIKAYNECPPLSYILNSKSQQFCQGKISVINPSTSKEKKGDVGKEWTRLYKQPNPLQTDKQFRSQVALYTTLFGYCPVLKVKPEAMDVVSQLWILPPQFLNIKTNSQYLFVEDMKQMIVNIEFEYKGIKTQIDKEDVYFFTDTTCTTDNLLLPTSRIESLRYPIGNLIKNYESRGTIMEKRGAIGILSPDGSDVGGAQRATPDMSEQLQNDYKRYGLLKDQWQLIISAISMKFTPMSLNLRELMLEEMANDDIMTLCDALGYKWQLLARGSESTFSNQQIAEKAQYQDNVIPMADNYMEQWNDCVNALENRVEYVIDFSHVACLQADEKVKSEVRKNNVSSISLQLTNNLITYGRAMEILEEEAPTELANLYFYQLPIEIQATFNTKQNANQTSQTTN